MPERTTPKRQMPSEMRHRSGDFAVFLQATYESFIKWVPHTRGIGGTLIERYLRIYVVRPPEVGAAWAVRVDAEKPVRFKFEKEALAYAIRQARARHGQGVTVELRVEDDLGHWRSMAL